MYMMGDKTAFIKACRVTKCHSECISTENFSIDHTERSAMYRIYLYFYWTVKKMVYIQFMISTYIINEWQASSVYPYCMWNIYQFAVTIRHSLGALMLSSLIVSRLRACCLPEQKVKKSL